MSKRSNIAIFCLVSLAIGAGFTLSLSAATDACADLDKSQTLFRQTSFERLKASQATLIEYSEKLNRIFQDLQYLEGKIPSNVDAEILKLETLVAEIENFSGQFFDYSDQDDQLFQGWSEAHGKCYGEPKLDLLNEWLVADVELLTSTAGFLSGFAMMLSEWPSEWRQIVSQKKRIPEGRFDVVEIKASELAESEMLLNEAHHYVDEQFQAARP